ncbi:MAG: twin-arginine translocase TatA/TatE family subunit [Nitrososphaerales archaeon]|nr:twin-arginine translocase TatA/TatE family subunit [Nitrososphaerales archaeon]|tara:strand:+ start:525 stop:824 length:300 start_codon:yes stop_codon:yes gene_type:complete
MAVGGMEWIWIVLAVGIFLVGTDKLPELARNLGKAMGEFQKSKSDFEREVKSYSEFETTTPSKSVSKYELQKSASALGIDATTKDEDQLREAIQRKLNS